MIDSYFDRCDAATGTWRTDRDHAVQSLYDDPRYFRGHFYSTMIDRNVAEARDKLGRHIERSARDHKYEICYGIRAGSTLSWFQSSGRRK